jgi:hypothetical protein
LIKDEVAKLGVKTKDYSDEDFYLMPVHDAGNSNWILDSGTTSHISGDSSKFKSIMKVSPSKVF